MGVQDKVKGQRRKGREVARDRIVRWGSAQTGVGGVYNKKTAYQDSRKGKEEKGREGKGREARERTVDGEGRGIPARGQG